jgi:hypothetical protein
MARGTPTHSPAISFRVEDRNNAITSNAALGAAVGFAKRFIRQENRRLLRNGKRTKLPKKKYNFAMPKKGIKRIEIESDPKWGWFVRIIGGGTTVGSFILIPWDHKTPDHRDTILVKSAAKNGPYEVSVQREFVGGIIDWKGPLRTEDLQGNELDPPQRDVLTWIGPDNRYGPQHTRRRSGNTFNGFGSYVGGAFIYKDGQAYARAPDILRPEGNQSPIPSTRVRRGVVCAASILRFDDSGPHLFCITDELDLDLGLGPDGLGEGKFHVWIKRDHNPTDLRFDIYDRNFPDGLTTGPGGRSNFRGGWEMVAEFSPPRGFYPERWMRSRMWFFNESGTECSTMLPVQERRPDGTWPAVIRNNTSWLGFSDPRITGVPWGSFPWTLQEATINLSVSFGGEGPASATMTLGNLNTDPVTSVRAPTVYDFNASGSTQSTFTDTTGDCALPEIHIGSGTQSDEQICTWNTAYSGGPWNVAVDYKGDTKVYAQLTLPNDVGFFQTVRGKKTDNLTALGVGLVADEIIQESDWTRQNVTGMDLVVGSTRVPMLRREETTNAAWQSTAKFNVSGLSVTLASYEVDGSETTSIETADTPQGSDNWLAPFGGAPMYIDLREDLVVWSVQTTRNVPSTSRQAGGGFNAFTWSPWDGEAYYATLIQVWRNGALVDEYRQDVDCPGANGAFSIGGAIFSRSLASEVTEDTYDFDECSSQDPPYSWIVKSQVVGYVFNDPDIGQQPASTTISGNDGSVGTAFQTPSLEYMAGPDTAANIEPTREFFLDWEHPMAIGVDGVGNLAFSIKTPGRRAEENNRFTHTVASSCQLTIPIEPRYFNYIDGDILSDVMNQVTYIEPGPDGEYGTPDDVTLDPLDPDFAHAVAWSISILG